MYPYLFADARYEKVRREGRVVSMAVMVAVGVRGDGHREIAGFEVGSEAWARSTACGAIFYRPWPSGVSRECNWW